MLAAERDDNDLAEVGDDGEEHARLSLLVALHAERLDDLDVDVARADGLADGTPLTVALLLLCGAHGSGVCVVLEWWSRRGGEESGRVRG